MDGLQKQYQALADDFKKATDRIQLDLLTNEFTALEAEMARADFWQDSQKAQKSSKRFAALKNRIEPWQRLKKLLVETGELLKLGDESMTAELTTQISQIEQQFKELKRQLRFNGPYDDHDTVLTIHAGAGGTDAQDWSQMLLRMYVRWAEHQNAAVETLEQTAGEEAGLKSVMLRISGVPFLYGKLKGEHGVHRLVRLSPFNADNLRQTSFAKVEVLPLIDTPEEVVIDEADLKIDVFRSGGHGGQSVNTTDSAVRVTHVPSGIVISIQNERSQLQNKETALALLRSRLAQLQLEQHQENLAFIKGPNQSAEWGNQIRSYVLHPYKMVKDLRSGFETSNTDAVLDGDINSFIEAYLETAPK